MALWRRLMERAEQLVMEKNEYDELHPPVTRITPEEADAQRKFTEIGTDFFTCNLCCHGANIPKEYNRTWDNWVVVRGVQVEGHNETSAPYQALICLIKEGICVAGEGDAPLREAIEKAKEQHNKGIA